MRWTSRMPFNTSSQGVSGRSISSGSVVRGGTHQAAVGMPPVYLWYDNPMLLGCRTPAWGAALVVLCLAVAAPGFAQQAEDPWTDIRADYRDGRFQSALARLERLVAANPNDR